MKRFLLVSLLALSVWSLQAQKRCAVLDFQFGSGVTSQDIEGIPYMFQSTFRPSGYTMLEAYVVKSVVRSLGYDPTDMSRSQILKVGRELTASIIVVSTINKFMDEYTVDVQVLDVARGATIAAESANFERPGYRAAMEGMSRRLMDKLGAAPAGGASSASSSTSSSSQERTEPYVLYGYLKVFPKDLGTFTSVPKTVIAQLNHSMQYGYGTWRLPTEEELSLMRDNNVIGRGNYMTDKSGTGIVRLVTEKEKGETLPVIPAGYVDLGLPSGTLWKEKNESGYFTYAQAVSRFGNSLPSKDELEELKDACQWSWTGSGYRVTGPSGESIYLPAAGWRGSDGDIDYVGSNGNYWSSTSNDSGSAWKLGFGSGDVSVYTSGRHYGNSVRLVQDK